MNNKEILEKTLDILKKDGWCKGRQLNDLGQHCLLGGLWDATFDYDDVVPLLTTCIDETELAKLGPRNDKFNSCDDWTKTGGESKIAGYNNDPEVEFEDIENLINCAIKKA